MRSIEATEIILALQSKIKSNIYAFDNLSVRKTSILRENDSKTSVILSTTVVVHVSSIPKLMIIIDRFAW